MMTFLSIVMIISVCSIAITMITTYFAFGDEEFHFYVKGFFISITVFFISLFFIIFPQIKCEKIAWETNDPYVVHKVISLNDSNQIYGGLHGGMFCSSDYINEKLVYTYAYKTSDGGIKTQRANADCSTIYYANSDYRAEWIKMIRHYWYYSENKTICHIYIPEGSVKQDYSIDLN